jgi:biotin transport system substrate-specific component
VLEEKPRTFPKTRGIVLASLFAILLSIFSLISIPLSPVPITLQVFAVFLIVNLLGSYYGTIACLVYLLLGAIGLPVFAGATGGIAVLFGPLGGFLFSFPLAAFAGGLVSGRVSRSKRADTLLVTLASAMSLLIVYIVGPLWLMYFLHLGLPQAYALGALPFIPLDVAKGLIAIPIAVYFRSTRRDLPVNWGKPTLTLNR